MLDSGVKFIKASELKGKIYVPMDIIGTMQAFEKYSQGNEYGLFLSAKVDSASLEATIESEIWEFPKQEVTGASIKFIDYRSDASFNAVVHRHPTGCNTFSGTDWYYINQDFEVSFLFINGGSLPMGMMHLKIDDNTIIQVPCTVHPIIDNKMNFQAELAKATAEAVEVGCSETLFKEKVKMPERIYAPHAYPYYGNNFGSKRFDPNKENSKLNLSGNLKLKAREFTKKLKGWFW